MVYNSFEFHLRRFTMKNQNEKASGYVPKLVTEDCTVYCSICNKSIDLKAGDAIPVCCGKVMVNLDA